MVRQRRMVSIGVALVLGLRIVTAQTGVVIDHVLKHVNADVITTLDVVEARTLHLVPVDLTGDDAIVEALVDRRLELADIARVPPPEPAAADVTARRARWRATLAPDADIPGLLARAGVTDAVLTAWFHDAAIIDAYEDQHFSGAPPSRDDISTFYRDHASEFTATDGTVRPLDDPTVQSDIKARIGAARKDAAVAAWIASLRNRADIW